MLHNEMNHSRLLHFVAAAELHSSLVAVAALSARTVHYYPPAEHIHALELRRLKFQRQCHEAVMNGGAVPPFPHTSSCNCT
jgi:hypothetical protein